jgi:hypothetical protein
MRFFEDTVVKMPELETKLTMMQFHLNDAKASIAKVCAIRARKQSPPPSFASGDTCLIDARSAEFAGKPRRYSPRDSADNREAYADPKARSEAFSQGGAPGRRSEPRSALAGIRGSSDRHHGAMPLH